LIEKIRITPIIKQKWTQEFNLKEENWENIFKIPRIIRDTKIRTFQYKLLFNLTPCNLYLFRIGRRNSYACDACNALDNITHYFFECPETNKFWESFQNWWNRMEDDNVKITKELALIGIVNITEKTNKLNACLQLARWYVYCEKLNLKSSFLYKFLCLLKYKVKIEKHISQGNNQISQYEKSWQRIEEYLD
jgi:hypothetical protein